MGKVIQRRPASINKSSPSGPVAPRARKQRAAPRSRVAARVRKAIKDCFPDGRLEDFGQSSRNDRIGAVLIWPGFEGMEPIERQERLWSALGEKLSLEDQKQVSLIITLTQKELDGIRSD